MTPEEFLQQSLPGLIQSQYPGATVPGLNLQIPSDKTHGDLSTNVAFGLAKQVHQSPRDLAAAISGIINNVPEFEKYFDWSKPAGAGFINFGVKSGQVQSGLAEILRQGDRYGHRTSPVPKKVLIEFVSANPTGPMNVVNARAAAMGDTLARIFQALGWQAEREYYINDAGNQVDLLAQSVRARWQELHGQEVAFPEDGYRGEYIRDLARAVDREISEGKITEAGLGERALQINLGNQRRALENYGVRYDNWFSEKKLRESGALQKVLDHLEKKNLLEKKEGALWFLSTQFGDDKDRVLVKQTGEPTYCLPDIAYHKHKADRGFDSIITLLGPDHHSYINQLRCALQALDLPLERFDWRILQHVRLIREGQEVKMSKRAGEFVTMDDLIEEVGVDASRYFFLDRKMNSHLDFDLTLAVTKSAENPVFYVQYAHARICNVFVNARDKNVAAGNLDQADPGLLSKPEELALIKTLAQWPHLLEEAGRTLEPHRITQFATQVAAGYHSFYHHHTIVDPANLPLSRARLALCLATGTLLKNCLNLMGINAPEKM
jgi:arginyl-tRNA synthetase